MLIGVPPSVPLCINRATDTKPQITIPLGTLPFQSSYPSNNLYKYDGVKQPYSYRISKYELCTQWFLCLNRTRILCTAVLRLVVFDFSMFSSWVLIKNLVCKNSFYSTINMYRPSLTFNYAVIPSNTALAHSI